MISVEQAKKILKEAEQLFSSPLESEIIALQSAHKRILAKNIYSSYDFPAFPNSAMDGFVFHRDDIVHYHTQKKPIPIYGEITAGDTPISFPRLQTLKIFTGAPIPDGANCVVPVEQCIVKDNHITITQELSSIKEGQHIRPKGLNFTKNECVLSQGTALNSMNMSVLASIGISSVEVFRKIKIAIGVTGNELTSCSNTTLAIGKIYDSNSVLLYQLCKEHGYEIVIADTIPDTLESTQKFLFHAVKHADIVLTTGGISMGDKDYLKILLNKLNATNTCRKYFQGVAIKPGKPFTFAHIQTTKHNKTTQIPLFCMPGNPLSAYITYLYFVVPYIHAISGNNDTSIMREQITAPCHFSSYPRTRFLFGIRDITEKTVAILEDQSSASIKNLNTANGALIIPANTVVEKNDPLYFFPFRCSC